VAIHEWKQRAKWVYSQQALMQVAICVEMGGQVWASALGSKENRYKNEFRCCSWSW